MSAFCFLFQMICFPCIPFLPWQLPHIGEIMDITAPPKYSNSRFPLFPPTTSPERGQWIARSSMPADDQGRYWHWDKLKDLPPPQDWSVEEWWAGMKWARNRDGRNLPFVGKNGAAFILLTPACVMAQLNWLEQNLRRANPIFEDGSGRNSFAAEVRKVEATCSCVLDGVAEKAAVPESFLGEGREPRNDDEWMVHNNHRALEHIRRRAGDELTPELMLELHRLLTLHPLVDPSLGGRLRTEEDGAALQGSDPWHEPPAAAGLEERVFRLCSFANTPAGMGGGIHPIICSVLLHLLVLYDQPFAFANGRLGRALFYWSMFKSGYELAELLSISKIMAAASGQYERSFRYVVSDENDATYFVIHQLDILIKAFQIFHMDQEALNN